MVEVARRRRWLWAGGVLVGLVATLLSLVLVPPSRGDIGPAALSVSAETGNGSTVIALPPLGTVEAPTHRSLVDVRLAVDQVDFELLAPLATTASGRDQLQQQINEDLRGLLLRAGFIQLGGAIVLAGLVSAALFRRRLLPVVASVVASATAVLTLLGLSVVTYDVEAFQRPRFTGTLTRASEVVATLQRSQDIFDEARSRLEIASRRVSDLITLLAQEDVDPLFQETVILHVSDLHANPIGVEITEELAREFDVDAIIDTGDLASSVLDTGEISSLETPLDRQLIDSIDELALPYFFVPGNHDSPALIEELQDAENITVFDGEVEDVVGIDILGWPDPTYSSTPVAEEDKEERRLREGQDVVAPEVEASSPDVLAVHDVRLAEASFGSVPLVLAGHVHDRAFDEAAGTTILTVGSTGATGLKSLTVEADRTFDAQILYFDDDRIVAVDYIRLAGITGDFQLERQTLTTTSAVD